MVLMVLVGGASCPRETWDSIRTWHDAWLPGTGFKCSFPPSCCLGAGGPSLGTEALHTCDLSAGGGGGWGHAEGSGRPGSVSPGATASAAGSSQSPRWGGRRLASCQSEVLPFSHQSLHFHSFVQVLKRNYEVTVKEPQSWSAAAAAGLREFYVLILLRSDGQIPQNRLSGLATLLEDKAWLVTDAEQRREVLAAHTHPPRHNWTCRLQSCFQSPTVSSRCPWGWIVCGVPAGDKCC